MANRKRPIVLRCPVTAEERAANVRLQWGRDLYQMNADTPETEEKEN